MEEANQPVAPPHFKGKDAIAHVVEAQASGIIASAEMHGTETSGKISAGADALRDCSLVLLINWQLLAFLKVDTTTQLYLLGIVGISLSIWKAGRSGWLGWSRLERLHRILAQEKWEIEHNRQQERDELRELYRAKGFEGKLLDDVLDVLMADGDRLLKVMVEEELGLSLESHEHPLVQSFGAALGALAATLMLMVGIYLNQSFGPVVAATLCMIFGATFAASHAKNRLIPATIWNLGLLALAYGAFYFLTEYFFRGL